MESEKTKEKKSVEAEKLPYPKSVFFIVGNEFCERFSYYGMKAILTMYLKFQLMFDEDSATVIYHVWSMLCYFMPIVGAIIADTLLGRYRTILYISFVYVAGHIFLSIADIIPIMPDLNTRIAISFIGLILIAFGTGGIKPNVSAFGGEQFVLPQQQRLLTQFFSIFYFSINAGSFISTFVTPVLRADVKCFGGDCYALAFGVPAILMVVALVLFVAGSAFYRRNPPEGNVVLKVGSCIAYALKTKWRTDKKKEHWLDHAQDKYETNLIDDVKALMKILLLFIPFPFFWALFDQQGSRWTFQATRMSGEIGNWNIKPDQMQMINPLLILMLIPLFDGCIYPCLAKCNILKKPLQRIFTGGVLAGVAFIVSGFLELQLEKTYPVAVSAGESRVTFVNGLMCNLKLNLTHQLEGVQLEYLNHKVYQAIKLGGANAEFEIVINSEDCKSRGYSILGSYRVNLQETKAHTLLITSSTNRTIDIVQINPSDQVEKSNDGSPSVRFIANLDPSSVFSENVKIFIKSEFHEHNFTISNSEIGMTKTTNYSVIESQLFEVYLTGVENVKEKESVGSFRVRYGGVYNVLINRAVGSASNLSVAIYEVTPANSIHMMWLFPQYFIITVSEVMFSITGLEFSFTQAPSSMKSVITAAYLLTVSFGNLIVVVVAESRLFDRQAMEFFLFAGLMFLDMILFAFLARSYKYREEETELKEDRDKQHHNGWKENGLDNRGFSDEETKM